MQNNTHFKIVLFAPEIPGNTGSIGRTCVALNLELLLIRPYGFEIDDKAVKRAGLDYWKFVQIREFDSWEDFLIKERPAKDKLLFFENNGEKLHYDAPYSKDCYLLFGGETRGFPYQVEDEYKSNFYRLPMYSENIRSLNLSNVATTVAYECMRNFV